MFWMVPPGTSKQKAEGNVERERAFPPFFANTIIIIFRETRISHPTRGQNSSEPFVRFETKLSAIMEGILYVTQAMYL